MRAGARGHGRQRDHAISYRRAGGGLDRPEAPRSRLVDSVSPPDAPTARSPALLAVLLLWAPPAFGHAAFVGSDPAPGQRVETSPARITLAFTEPLNRRLARATLRPAAGGPPRSPPSCAAPVTGGCVVIPRRRWQRGAYRVAVADRRHPRRPPAGGLVLVRRARRRAAPRRLLETGPLARGGWVRVVARGALYGAALLLVAALLLPLLVRGPRGWPVPELPGSGLDTERLRERAARADRRPRVADAWRPRCWRWWPRRPTRRAACPRPGCRTSCSPTPRASARVLAGRAAGGLRAGARARARAAAAALAVLALGALAASGHAGSADPRVPSILNDWLHLVAGAAWLGGIACSRCCGGGRCAAPGAPARLAVAREVLGPFGRVAAGAFAVVASTGLVSLVTQLGRVAALWDTSYGRLLAVKIAVVGADRRDQRRRTRCACARACWPPTRTRPSALERRHWRLWRRGADGSAIAVVGVVAALAAFPLPPRQLAEAGGAPAPVCDPCPLPRPGRGRAGGRRRGGLAARRRAGSAARRRRSPGRCASWTPRAPVEAAGGGAGARARRLRPRLPALPPAAATRRRGRGRGARARHAPTRYACPRPGRRARAPARGALLGRAEATMRGLRGVRELERLTSGPGHERDHGVPPDRARPARVADRRGRDGRRGRGKRQWVKAPGVGLARRRVRLRARLPHAHAGSAWRTVRPRGAAAGRARDGRRRSWR